MINDVECLFMCHLYLFFGKMSIQILYLFFNQVVWFYLKKSCMSSLYILNVNSLSSVSFVNIFPCLVDGLFVSPIVSFFSLM